MIFGGNLRIYESGPIRFVPRTRATPPTVAHYHFLNTFTQREYQLHKTGEFVYCSLTTTVTRAICMSYGISELVAQLSSSAGRYTIIHCVDS